MLFELFFYVIVSYAEGTRWIKVKVLTWWLYFSFACRKKIHLIFDNLLPWIQMTTFWGPKYILRAVSLKQLSSDQVKRIAIEAGAEFFKSSGFALCCVAGNCNTKRCVNSKFGACGKVVISDVQHQLRFLIYDYVFIFKNVRINWVTHDEVRYLIIMRDRKL